MGLLAPKQNSTEQFKRLNRTEMAKLHSSSAKPYGFLTRRRKIRVWTTGIKALTVYSRSKRAKMNSLQFTSKVSDRNLHSESQFSKLEEVSNFTVYFSRQRIICFTFLVLVQRIEPRALGTTGKCTRILLLFMSKLQSATLFYEILQVSTHLSIQLLI